MIKPGDFVVANRNTSNLVINDFYDVLAVTVDGKKAYVKSSFLGSIFLEPLENLEKP